jgi:hypothetical protein
MFATIARQYGHVEKELSEMPLTMNVAKMAKEGCSQLS